MVYFKLKGKKLARKKPKLRPSFIIIKSWCRDLETDGPRKPATRHIYADPTVQQTGMVDDISVKSQRAAQVPQENHPDAQLQQSDTFNYDVIFS